MKRILLIALLLSGAAIVQAQLAKNSRWVKGLKDRYDVTLHVPYTFVDTANARLDVYVPKLADGPMPVLIWIHGGGWGRLSKDSVSGQILPYLEMGWVVVNVDYRLTPVALAPAAVEDCRCALQWVYANAGRIKADVRRIVVSGTSAGGHLALITGMVPAGSVLDRNCPDERLAVAAIVNFYGIADVADLQALSKNRRGYAISWIGDRPEADSIARLVSPLMYVRKDLPPIFTVHGDMDPTVPYDQAVRLHKALTEAGVSNELMTIPGGVHGTFSREQNSEIMNRLLAFFELHGLWTSSQNESTRK